VLAYAILHVLIAERLIDGAYIEARTSGFADVRRTAEREHPERAERLTGVAAQDIRAAARVLAGWPKTIVLTGRGIEQHTNGTDCANAFINIALVLGLPGKPGAGYGTITGQGNGQGGREHGQKSDQLPGYATLDDPAAVERVARVWGVEPERIARRGLAAAEILTAAGNAVHGLFIMGSNPAVCAPDAAALRERLAAMEHLVVCDFFRSETAELADVVLPVLQWAEEPGTMTWRAAFCCANAVPNRRRARAAICKSSATLARDSGTVCSRAPIPRRCSTNCGVRAPADEPTTAALRTNGCVGANGWRGRFRRPIIRARRFSSQRPSRRPMDARASSTPARRPRLRRRRIAIHGP
jgi:anaerobic selenocysteine-containing dehydrogenase